MATSKIPAHVLQAYLAQTPPETEVNLNTLATELSDKLMQEAFDYFSALSEPNKVSYLVFFYNYYHYALTGGSFLFDPQEGFSEEFIVEIEDFMIKYNLNTTELVPLRRLVSSLQKLTAKQRQHRKEGFSSES